jgi:hypothetical protein
VIERRLSYLKEQVVLARHALVVGDQFSLDPYFGPVSDAMDHVDEKIAQRINQFTRSQMAERREQSHPDRHRMTPQLVHFFHRYAAAVALDDS